MSSRALRLVLLAAFAASPALRAGELPEPPPSAEDLEPSRDLLHLASAAKPSVVYLEVLDSSGKVVASGSGFFVSADGMIATNEHVVEDAYEMRARLATGETRKILGAVLRSRDNDLALIRAEAGTYPPLPLGTDVEVKEGMPVVNIGNPLGLSFTLSEGIVSALRPNGVPEDLRGTEDDPAQKQPLIQISAFSAGGASGSPVLSANGKVIGVIRSGIGGQSSFTFAVPAAALAKLMASVEPGAKPKPFRSFPMKGLVISAVVYGVLMAGWLVLRWRKRRQPKPAPVATNRQYRR